MHYCNDSLIGEADLYITARTFYLKIFDCQVNSLSCGVAYTRTIPNNNKFMS